MMLRRIAIFASFSPTPEVQPYIIYHLQKLRELCDEVWFVSNSKISENSRLEISNHCSNIIERENIGYDFSGWRDAISKIKILEFDEVILTNSSVIGPLFDLSGVFNEMDKRPCDLWGMTQSQSHKMHIQSYFICFKKNVIISETWNRFWRSVHDESDKWDVIKNYEVGLLNFFQSDGFVGDSFIPVINEIGLRRIFLRRIGTKFPLYIAADKNVTNPTIHSPLKLIESGMPYLKASLIWGHNKNQPFPLEKIMALPNIDYDWSLIGLENEKST